MNLLSNLLCCVALLVILVLPVHIAALNKKEPKKVFWIRLIGWAFGWTIIGYLIALYLASKPK